ncbi:MAG: cytochrome c biogenesis protein CcsA [Magnetococcales bacterium]|nr:cytochrome c biogenesis protein CcsA [Magnetococcales bacterium]
MIDLPNEHLLLWSGLGSYFVAGVLAILGLIFQRFPARLVALGLWSGLILHGASLGLRWERLGHGPFINLFEILSSNIWSFTLAFALFYWRLPRLRPGAVVILPMIFVMMGWLLRVHPGDSTFPPTYDTYWLYIHIGLGKVAMGILLMAAGVATIITQRHMFGQQRLAMLPDNATLDEFGYRCVAVAFVFHTLMLLAGAIWAQDAWGRYWAWDPLETWTLHSWLLMALYLHLRPLFHPPPLVAALAIWVVFVAAFLVFFGVPFLSTSTHQGIV